MLVIKVELWKHGDEKQKKTIAEMKIINTGDHVLRPLYGNYVAKIKDMKAKILNHDRRDNVWYLIRDSIDVVLNKYKL